MTNIEKGQILDDLILCFMVNDLINKRMMGNQRDLGKETPMWQPSGWGCGLAHGGGDIMDSSKSNINIL